MGRSEFSGILWESLSHKELPLLFEALMLLKGEWTTAQGVVGVGWEGHSSLVPKTPPHLC